MVEQTGGYNFLKGKTKKNSSLLNQVHNSPFGHTKFPQMAKWNKKWIKIEGQDDTDKTKAP